MTKKRAWIVVALMLFSSYQVLANEGDPSWESFVQGIGKSIYFMAWPTATYRGAEFKEIRQGSNGTDVVFVVYGNSAFGGGNLWVEVVVTVRDASVVDLRWGDNNAILSQPGQTMKNLGEALRDLNNQSRVRENPSTVRLTWVLADRCQDNIGIQVRLFDKTNNFVWPNEGKVYIIPSGGKIEVSVDTYKGASVCIGAEPDSRSANVHWGVGLSNTYGCDACCYSADNRRVEWPLGCN